ncbi:MAG: tRNA (adenosine(37)-N6)-dimethylallyltransferase MiaA [Bacteroidota bacterium]
MKNTCIIIVGPTAVGKTAIAIQLARHFSTEIISCDSRQCFKELNIGVAKPSAEELTAVKHHFINSHSIHDTVNAAIFEQYALEKAGAVFSKNKMAVMVGGTGLYVKAFCDGIDEVPEVDASVRTTIITNYNNNGIEWLRDEVKKYDEKYFSVGEIFNPQRMMRALEVKMSTGRSILDFHSKKKKPRDFDIIKIGIELPRPELIERINKRVDIMMQDGLEEEVRALLPYQHLNALQTVGYRELFPYFDKEINLLKALETIKTNTRQYAKRQMTWFKKDETISWCAPVFDKVLAAVSSYQK